MIRLWEPFPFLFYILELDFFDAHEIPFQTSVGRWSSAAATALGIVLFFNISASLPKPSSHTQSFLRIRDVHACDNIIIIIIIWRRNNTITVVFMIGSCETYLNVYLYIII